LFAEKRLGYYETLDLAHTKGEDEPFSVVDG